MSSVIYQPSVFFSLTGAPPLVSNAPQRLLVVGQKEAAGSAADGAWEQNIGNEGQEKALYGRQSQLAEMIRAVKRLAPGVRLDAICKADHASGVARVVTGTLSGTATAAGTIKVVIGSERLYSYTVAIASGTTAANAVSAMSVEILNADRDTPFVFGNSGAGVFTFTAVNKGTVANQVGIEVTVNVAGLTLSSLTQTTAGATDPTLASTLFDVVASTRYQGVIWAWPAGVDVLVDWLESRFNVADTVLDGVGFTGISDTYANLLTELDTAKKNSKSLVVITDEAQTEAAKYLGPAMTEMNYVKAAQLAAIRALRLTPGEAISQFVVTPAPLDQIGGPALASLPLFNTRFPHLPVPRNGRGFTKLEVEGLKAAGGTVLGQDPSFSNVIAGEVVTTYLTNGAGIPDQTWRYLEVVDTASQVREFFTNNCRSRFIQSRLTEGAVHGGRDMVNRLVFDSFLTKLYEILAGRDYVLVQDGETAVKFFRDSLDTVLDLSTGTISSSMQVPLVTQTRNIVVPITIVFSTQR